MNDANNGNGHPQGQTLWEMLRSKISGGNRAGEFYNPLRWRVHSAVPDSVRPHNARDCDFSVAEMRVVARHLAGREFTFTDYALKGINQKHHDAEDTMSARLRVVPNTAGAHDALWLALYDEFEFSEDFLAVVRDGSGLFEVTDDSGHQAEYHRLNDLRDSYKAVVRIVTATDDEGLSITARDQWTKLEYWDYWREAPIGGGPTTRKEFLFVEMNGDNGWFQIWRGSECYLR